MNGSIALRLYRAVVDAENTVSMGAEIDPAYAVESAAKHHAVNAGDVALRLWTKSVQCERARHELALMDESDA